LLLTPTAFELALIDMIILEACSITSREYYSTSLFVWLVADGWCWFVLREKYCWLVADDCFILREKYCWLVADKPNEHGVHLLFITR
jgi:hypothetical protein